MTKETAGAGNRIRTEQELDRALKDLAETAPEMPADFHERWMAAVRQKAAAPEMRHGPAAGKRGRVPWTRMLSAAAALVLLAGGTWLALGGRQAPETQAARTANSAGPAVEAADAAVAAEMPAAMKGSAAAPMEAETLAAGAAADEAAEGAAAETREEAEAWSAADDAGSVDFVPLPEQLPQAVRDSIILMMEQVMRDVR